MTEKINAVIKNAPDKYGALIYCDIDNLKFINECYGHDDGDKYILAVANSLRIFESDSAVLARPSGDDFVVYIHGFDSEEAIKNYINLKFVEAKNSYFTSSLHVEEKVRFSTGVALYPTDSTELEYLIKFADYALINMKKSSKGETGYYDKTTFDKSTFLLKNRGYLDQFLDNKLLDFALQPIVDAKTFEIYGYEALMRPTIDIISSPYLLLQLAKEESKLDKVEKLVMQKVFEKIHKNIGKLQHRKVFVNSIADQLLTKEELAEYIKPYPNILNNVVIEITEQEYVDEEFIKAKTNMLREFGVFAIALDDYGAGYSNEFTLLSGLYDIVKVDMKLIRNIDTDLKRQEILNSIIKVSQYNNYKVLAEGVETENEVKVLKGLGVDYFQGYYFGRPDFEVKGLSDSVLRKIKNL